MDYVSTRGGAASLDFEGVTLAGLASDALQLLTSLVIDRIDIIGHSLGGVITHNITAKSPRFT